MSNNDMNKALADVLNNMDKKTLQENLNKALDVLKNGNTGELAKQIASVSKNQQDAKPNNTDQSVLNKVQMDADAIENLNNTDLEKLLKYIGSHGDEIKSKLKDIIK